MREMSTTPRDERTYSVNELADEAGVTRRTVHYYIAQGLLPASGTEGRGTRYGQGHLDRLLLIRELQREHLPLAEIRQRLEHLRDDQVADLLATGEMLPKPRGTAFDYIQSVLAGANRRGLPLAQPRPAFRTSAAVPSPPAVAAPATLAVPQAPGHPAVQPDLHRAPIAGASRGAGATRVAEQTPLYPSAEPPHPAAPALMPLDAPPTAVTRSQWERIALAPDVELHVRRPLSRIKNRAVDRLVALARQLLEEDPS